VAKYIETEKVFRMFVVVLEDLETTFFAEAGDTTEALFHGLERIMSLVDQVGHTRCVVIVAIRCIFDFQLLRSNRDLRD